MTCRGFRRIECRSKGHFGAEVSGELGAEERAILHLSSASSPQSQSRKQTVQLPQSNGYGSVKVRNASTCYVISVLFAAASIISIANMRAALRGLLVIAAP